MWPTHTHTRRTDEFKTVACCHIHQKRHTKKQQKQPKKRATEVRQRRRRRQWWSTKKHIWFTNSHVCIWWLLFIVLPFERFCCEKKREAKRKKIGCDFAWGGQTGKRVRWLQVCKMCFDFYRRFENRVLAACSSNSIWIAVCFISLVTLYWHCSFIFVC